MPLFISILLLIVLIFLLVLLIGYFISLLISDFKGAPFIRNDNLVIQESLEMLELDDKDVFYDLGSGDGKVLLMAAEKYKVGKIIGCEISYYPYWISNIRARFALDTNSNITILRKDILNYDYSDATKIYVYLLPSLLERLSAKLKTLKKETSEVQIVSPVFQIKGMIPIKTKTVYHKGFKKNIEIYLY